MLQKLTKVDPMASCHPYTHLLVKIKPRDVFLGKGQQKPTWRRALARCEGVAGGRRGTDVRRHGEQMSYVPKLIHSQADSFTGEFHPSRGLCGYALLLSSGNVPVTGALPDPPSSRKHVDLQRRGPIIV